MNPKSSFSRFARNSGFLTGFLRSSPTLGMRGIVCRSWDASASEGASDGTRDRLRYRVGAGRSVLGDVRTLMREDGVHIAAEVDGDVVATHITSKPPEQAEVMGEYRERRFSALG